MANTSQETVALTATAKASKALVSATAALSKVVLDLTATTAINEKVLEDISEGQTRLDQLAADTDTAVRTQAVELGLQVRENSDKVLGALMNERGLASITRPDLKSLEKELLDSKANSDKLVSIAVETAVAEVNATAEAESIKKDAAHSVEIATLAGEIKSLASHNVHLESTIAQLQGTIKEERVARVEVAKASQTVIHQTSDK